MFSPHSYSMETTCQLIFILHIYVSNSKVNKKSAIDIAYLRGRNFVFIIIKLDEIRRKFKYSLIISCSVYELQPPMTPRYTYSFVSQIDQCCQILQI